jgi:hypothetical protein
VDPRGPDDHIITPRAIAICLGAIIAVALIVVLALPAISGSRDESTAPTPVVTQTAPPGTDAGQIAQ